MWSASQILTNTKRDHLMLTLVGSFTIFSPAVSASSDLSGQRSVLRQGREGAVTSFGATIVGIINSNANSGSKTLLLVGGQDPTDLETQGRPQRLRPRASLQLPTKSWIDHFISNRPPTGFPSRFNSKKV